ELGSQDVVVPVSLVASAHALTVRTTPPDATVSLEDPHRPFTQGMKLSPGEYVVSARAEGYKDSRQRVRISGSAATVNLALEKLPPPPPPAPAAHKVGDTWREPTTGMEFVWVAGGCYMMGSNDGDSDEKPVHEVCVGGFWLGKYEVTQAEWKALMGSNPSHFKGDRNPVEMVSWDDAQSFIRKLNSSGNGRFRLPTEAEWEYAARSGGKNEKYAGGNDVGRVAWYDGNSGRRTHPVGGKAPNGLGLYDMSGNVWEWCEDWYDKDAYSKHANSNPISNNHASGTRVLRGGCWYSYPSDVRSANRIRSFPGSRSSSFGFRVVRLPQE
ncbi:MAG: SUMF1/EgtB/PvdO family nonheme iron enzyme, partial [Pseudomonadota bacterium]